MKIDFNLKGLILEDHVLQQHFENAEQCNTMDNNNNNIIKDNV